MHFIEQPGKQTDLVVVGKVAEHELRELLRHRAQVNRRIAVLRKAIRAVLGDEGARHARTSTVVRLTPRKREGITHACRSVLAQSLRPLTVREIAEQVRVEHAAAAAGQRDLFASISAVLRYLLESGEANNTFNEEGNRTWFAVATQRPD